MLSKNTTSLPTVFVSIEELSRRTSCPRLLAGLQICYHCITVCKAFLDEHTWGCPSGIKLALANGSAGVPRRFSGDNGGHKTILCQGFPLVLLQHGAKLAQYWWAARFPVEQEALLVRLLWWLMVSGARDYRRSISLSDYQFGSCIFRAKVVWWNRVSPANVAGLGVIPIWFLGIFVLSLNLIQNHIRGSPNVKKTSQPRSHKRE